MKHRFAIFPLIALAVAALGMSWAPAAPAKAKKKKAPKSKTFEVCLHGLAVDPYVAFGRPHQTDHHPDSRGFSGSIGAEKSSDFAFVQVEA